MKTFILKWSCRMMCICWTVTFYRRCFHNTARTSIFAVIICNCTIIVIIYTITTARFAICWRCRRRRWCWCWCRCWCMIYFLVLRQLFVRSIALWRWSYTTIFDWFHSIRSLKYKTMDRRSVFFFPKIYSKYSLTNVKTSNASDVDVDGFEDLPRTLPFTEIVDIPFPFVMIFIFVGGDKLLDLCDFLLLFIALMFLSFSV